VDRQNLFRLDIGKLENQIDLFGLDQSPVMLKTRIAMRDGIFYISDSKAQKVMKFTSYGDLLSMIYNQETNPPPFTLKKTVRVLKLLPDGPLRTPSFKMGM